ncbi:MAG: 4Fe-4S ferredoxin [Methanobrevibacter sp.]|nr:4Fe-4S ferredoxin [Methanobrevibacter sp.]
MKKIILYFLIFEIIAIGLFLLTDNFFYYLNFTYIGLCITIGLYLYNVETRYSKYARNFIQITIGLYLLIYLGILSSENMMLEGFWYYLFLGVFEAAVIHYAIAKIFGPFLFGRGWCGYACWTAMILDLLPYKTPNKKLDHKREKYGYIKYILFIISPILVSALFILKMATNTTMFYLFIIVNILYYIIGIILAYHLKDNRAFCKYICPITVFLKIGSKYSLLKIKYDENKCDDCKKCYRSCPMDVDICSNDKNKTNATECILCMSCAKSCKKNALYL